MGSNEVPLVEIYQYDLEIVRVPITYQHCLLFDLGATWVSNTSANFQQVLPTYDIQQTFRVVVTPRPPFNTAAAATVVISSGGNILT